MEGESLGLNGGDDGGGGFGMGAARGDVDGKVRTALVVLVDELFGDLAAVRGQVVLLVNTEKEDHGVGIGRVEVADELLLGLGERLLPGEGDDVGARHEAQVRAVVFGERGELVQEEERGRRVGEGRPEKVMVGAEEGEAVERAAGEVVCDFGAEGLGELRVLGGEHGKVGNGHCGKFGNVLIRRESWWLRRGVGWFKVFRLYHKTKIYTAS